MCFINISATTIIFRVKADEVCWKFKLSITKKTTPGTLLFGVLSRVKNNNPGDTMDTISEYDRISWAFLDRRGRCNTFANSPCGKMVIGVTDNQTIIAWDIKTGAHLYTYRYTATKIEFLFVLLLFNELCVE